MAFIPNTFSVRLDSPVVSLNIGNVPTVLYNAMLELRGKLHAHTWVQVLEYLMQDPEGLIDMEFMSIDGHPFFDEKGKLQVNHKIVFRAGKFVHEYDPSRSSKERFRELGVFPPMKNLVSVFDTPIGKRNGQNH